jgi:hypothetical protein
MLSLVREASKASAAVGILLLPKCGLCLAAYMNLFSIFGISMRNYASWVFPVLLAMLLVNLVIGYFKARKSGLYYALLCSIFGVLLLLTGKLWLLNAGFVYGGLLFLTAGSLLQIWQSRKTCSRSFY